MDLLWIVENYLSQKKLKETNLNSINRSRESAYHTPLCKIFIVMILFVCTETLVYRNQSIFILEEEISHRYGSVSQLTKNAETWLSAPLNLQ